MEVYVKCNAITESYQAFQQWGFLEVPGVLSHHTFSSWLSTVAFPVITEQLFYKKNIYIYMYIWMVISLYRLYPSIYLSIYLPIYLSTYLSIYLSTCLSVYLSIHPSIYMCISLYLPIYASTSLPTYLYLSHCQLIYRPIIVTCYRTVLLVWSLNEATCNYRATCNY